MRTFIRSKNEISEAWQYGRCDKCNKEYEMSVDWDGRDFLCSTDCFVDQLSSLGSRAKLTKLMKPPKPTPDVRPAREGWGR